MTDTYTLPSVYLRHPQQDAGYLKLKESAIQHFASNRKFANQLDSYASITATDFNRSAFTELLTTNRIHEFIVCQNNAVVGVREYTETRLPEHCMAIINSIFSDRQHIAIWRMYALAAGNFDCFARLCKLDSLVGIVKHDRTGYTPCHVLIATGATVSDDTFEKICKASREVCRDTEFDQSILHFALRADLNIIVRLSKTNNMSTFSMKSCINQASNDNHVLDIFYRMKYASAFDGKYSSALVDEVESILAKYIDTSIVNKFLTAYTSAMIAKTQPSSDLAAKLREAEATIRDLRAKLSEIGQICNNPQC